MEGGIGTLAVLSPKPNQFTEQHASILGVLARQVMMRLEYSVHSKGQDHSLRSRQRIERALTVERNFVSAVLDTMSALVLVVDTAGRIVRFNRACEEISGYTFAELAGRSFPQELFLTEERSQAFDLIEQSRRDVRREPTELHWLSRDGRRRRIAWNTTTLTDGLGDINFIIMTGVDVTDQREATSALHASEARYRQLVESSLGMVCTHDLEGKIGVPLRGDGGQADDGLRSRGSEAGVRALSSEHRAIGRGAGHAEPAPPQRPGAVHCVAEPAAGSARHAALRAGTRH
jgi:PAS domain S-box-containing protein